MGCCCSTDDIVYPTEHMQHPPMTQRPPVSSYPPPAAPCYPPAPGFNPMQNEMQSYPTAPAPGFSVPSYPAQPSYPAAAPMYPPLPCETNLTSDVCSDSAYKWVHGSAGRQVPPNAVVGGQDIDGTRIYVGRAFHEGDMLPAKVIPEKDVAYVAHGGVEHAKHTFEVLVQGEFAWEFSSNGAVPADAVVAGQTSDGEPLYVGRVLHNGSQTVGKVQQSHGCLYIPFDGQELSFKDYEVLVMH